jgi:trk system potassium uptake protein TrkH
MTDGAETLTYAVRLHVLGKYLGQLALMLAALACVPLAASFVFHEYHLGLRYLAVIALLTLLGGVSLRLPDAPKIQNNESLVIVALAFVLSPLVMLYPMLGAGLPVMDTLFEAVSAVTTTGLSTLPHAQDMPRTFLLARAWMQWYGGLGIVVLSIALLMGHRMATRRLSEPVSDETLVTASHVHARHMLLVYSALTLFFLLLVWSLTGDGFTALTHVLAAVSTGGFSTFDDSLAGLEHWSARYVVIIACLCGAIPLPLYYRLRQGAWREAARDLELRALLVCSLLLIGVLTWLMAASMSWNESLRHAALIGISAQTTAGFTSLPIAQLDDASKIALIVSMFIGGGVGSTAGGIKLLRLLILFRLLQFLMQRTAMPSHAVAEPRLGGKVLESDDVQRIMVLILLFGSVTLLSWFTFVGYGYEPLDALFEVVSATGTVGLSTGITSQELPAFLKAVLCVDMLLGRLEIVALLVVLYPRTWFGNRA